MLAALMKEQMRVAVLGWVSILRICWDISTSCGKERGSKRLRHTHTENMNWILFDVKGLRKN